MKEETKGDWGRDIIAENKIIKVNGEKKMKGRR